ncbi:MAG: HD domain-containing protein [Clostridia bacterium]|nr:HD domain-containing protein [Clostridia bacterium]
MKRLIEISENAREVLLSLEKSGYEAYIVGGCVRDAILGNQTNDYDITTSALPEEVKKVFSNNRVIETGIKHGTLTVILNGEAFEITTYRSDGKYTDSRHPDSVSFSSSLKEDLKRRDFTINALVCNSAGEVSDFYDGITDIERKTIRTIGNAEKRFSEDALRILRAVRFSSSLGFDIEQETKDAMVSLKSFLSKVSKERIANEINRTLCAKNVKNVLLENWQIFGEIIPEIKQMRNFDQRTKYHIYDVLEHTACVISNTPSVVYLRLAGLLHDTGKVYTFVADENGVGHFPNHSEKSVEIAKRYLDEYKYDNFTKERVIRLIKYHDLRFKTDRVSIKRYLNKFGAEFFFDLIELGKADKGAQNPELDTVKAYAESEAVAKDIISAGECFSFDTLAIKGNDLAEIGFSGKGIGNALKELLSEVIEEKTENTRAALLKSAEKFLN